MKKNISINISGIIFHIEEDGYSSLKTYLESITRYFSSYEDSKEIISDIESRIAEIFLTKLSDGKQVITLEDVENLIHTMGTIADFDALEAEEEQQQDEQAQKQDKEQKAEEKKSTSSRPKEDDPGKKRLFRDDKRKVLGGVAAGMAYFFSIDPLWIRLVFAALLLNVFNVGFSGGVFIAYIVLWIVIPVSKDLGDDEGVKKMFRDPGNQVLGGVASGVAAYFGIDVTIIRLLFVLSIFLGGSGLILYIILWMITPVARTITEKMQMQGEPVTLSNIQHTVNKTLKTKEGEESAFAKILLFPFRVLAELFRVIGELLGPISKLLLTIMRVVVGIIITLVGFAGIIAMFGVLGVLLGLFTAELQWESAAGVLPVEILSHSFPVAAYVAAFLITALPLLVLTLLGISLLAKRFVISSAIAWAVLGVWLLGIVIALFTIPNAVASFKTEGEDREVVKYEFSKTEPLIIKLSPEDMEDMTKASLRIRATDDSLVRLVVIKEARGKTRSQASSNAQMIDYRVRQIDNELIFDPHFTFKNEAKFRAQQLRLVLYVPMETEFVVDSEMREILKGFGNEDYGIYDANSEVRWKYGSAGLVCVTCPQFESSPGEEDEEVEWDKDSDDLEYYGAAEEAMNFAFRDFNALDARGFYKVFVEKGDEYNVVVNGSDDLKKLVVIEKSGELLKVGVRDGDWDILETLDDDKRLEVYITMPELNQVYSSGACQVIVGRFESSDFKVQLSGASSCELDLKVDQIEVDLEGASTLELSGQADHLVAEVSGASNLKAFDFRSKHVEVEASGASNAKVKATESIDAEASGISVVKFKGRPERKNLNEDGFGKIRSSD